MNTQSTISSVVMRRVHTIRLLRPLFSATAFASALFLLAVWGIGREVWVAHVVANFSGAAVSPEKVVIFLTAAFVNTRFIVQALTVVAGGAFVWALHNALQNFTPSRRYA